MKITDVSVTMFNWKSAPWNTGTGSFGGNRLLGIVTVHTNEGIEGHAFLGELLFGLADHGDLRHAVDTQREYLG